MKLWPLLSLALTISVNAAQVKKDPPKVNAATAELTSIEKTLLFPAQVKSRTDSKIKSDGNYIVIKRLVRLGQKISKDEPILILQNQDTTTHYESRTLRSPVSGTVASIMVEKGQYIQMSDDLIHINDPKDLYINIQAAAIDYKKLKMDLPGKLNITSLGLKDIPVSVAAVGTAVDSVTGTINVELSIDKANENLVPGVIGMAEISLNKESLLLVKEKALYYIGEDILIATLKEDGTVTKSKVKLGKRIKDNMEIIEGLEIGDTFIAESPKFLREGETVEVIEKE